MFSLTGTMANYFCKLFAWYRSFVFKIIFFYLVPVPCTVPLFLGDFISGKADEWEEYQGKLKLEKVITLFCFSSIP